MSIDGGEGTVQFDRDGILYDHNSEKQTKIYFGKAEEGLTDVYTADEAEDKVHVQ